MLQRLWSCFRSDDNSNRTSLKVKYVQLNDLSSTNSRRHEDSIENPNRAQISHIHKERAFQCREVHKDVYSSSHWKMVNILRHYEGENLDGYTKEQAKAVMNKAFPILEKIFLEESIKKFYTSWLTFFYALPAKHKKFSEEFKEFFEECWRKSDKSQLKNDAYVWACIVAQDSRVTRRVLKTKLSCYEDFKEEMKLIYQETKSRAIFNN